ncbi:MAG: hypothetical protein ABIA63_05445, partial [bacterium]
CYLIFGNMLWMHKVLVWLILGGCIILFYKYCCRYFSKTRSLFFILLISWSSALHMLSSYLYSETFFLCWIIIVIYAAQKWNDNLSAGHFIVITLLAAAALHIRYMGMAVGIAWFLFLLSGKKYKYFIIACIVFAASVFLLEFYSGTTPQASDFYFKGITRSGQTGWSSPRLIWLNFRSYFFTIIPDSIVGTAYHLRTADLFKLTWTGMISLLTFTGFLLWFKKDRLVWIFCLVYMGALLVYATRYVRLIMPVIPFIIIFFFNGLYFVLHYFKNARVNKIVFILIFIWIFSDNIFLSCTNPRRFMPVNIPDSYYSQCLDWAINNLPAHARFACAHSAMVYVKRDGFIRTPPYLPNPADALAFLEKEKIDYILYGRPGNLEWSRDIDSYLAALTIAGYDYTVVYGDMKKGSALLKINRNNNPTSEIIKDFPVPNSQ